MELQFDAKMLFYLNGVIEGLIGAIEWAQPGYFQGKPNQLNEDALFYARIVGPFFVGMSAASIYMDRQPDTVSKQLFACGWLLYHVTVTSRRLKQLFTTGAIEPKRRSSTVVHFGFAIAFIYYLKNTQFDAKVLLFQPS